MPIAENAYQIGSFSEVLDWPIIGLHAALTPDGRVLTFGTDQNGQQSGLHIYDVWDPVTNTHTTLSHTTNADLFCAVAAIIPETGEILIAGGDARPAGGYNSGISDVTIFDYRDLSLEHSPTGPMQFARWYGTSVTTETGQIVLIGGRDGSPADNVQYSPYVEIYTPGFGFRTLTGAYIDTFNITSLYPRSWMTSNGDIWTTSDGTGLVYSINLDGHGSVTEVGAMPTAISWSIPSVMYAPDRVLLIGNDGSAWIMDMSGPAPVYERTDDVGPGRIWANLTVLPDGRIMCSGGSAVDLELIGVQTLVRIWDPRTGEWTDEASAAVPRLYHSTAILLPDGTVLTQAGGAPGPLANLNAEIFSPEYLYDEGGILAPRPVIEAAPDRLDVGQDFTLTVSGAEPVVTLALMKFGSVTHSFDTSSQRIELAFTVNPDGTLNVDLPDNAHILTPGSWMLFALDASGTPSIAATIAINRSVDYSLPTVVPFEDGIDFSTNGASAYDGYDDSFTLTPNAQLKAGSVLSDVRLDMTQAFSITFQINVGASDAGSDGLAFVLHNDARGADALGSAGSGMGVLGIQNGLAIEFDTFFNEAQQNELANDHTNFVDTDSEAALSTAYDLGNIEDGNWHNVQVTWTGTTLSYSIDGVTIGSLTQDLVANYFGGSNFAYFGFTAGTGGGFAQQQVRLMALDGVLEGGATLNVDRGGVSIAPVIVANGDASYDAASNTYTLSPDAPEQHGSIMTQNRIDLTQSFDLEFRFNVGNKDAAGADGFAIVLHNDPLGSNALGGMGGATGALNINNGLALQFDTHQAGATPADVSNDFLKVIDTDSEVLAQPSINLGNIEDGAWHTVTLSWNGVTLTYAVDGVQIGTLTQDIVADYLAGSQYAYLGLTAATGGQSELTQVRIDRLDATAEDGSALSFSSVIEPNTVSVAVDDTYTIASGGTLVIDAQRGVLANDYDPDGDVIQIRYKPTSEHSDVPLAPRHGTVTMNLDGSFTYVADAGFVGTDSFIYYMGDSRSCCHAQVTINVTGAGAQPVVLVANGNASATAQDFTYTVTPDAELQRGSVMSQQRISLDSAFQIAFDINLGTRDSGADGMAFVLHNDAAGANALGGLGGAMGAMNIANGLAIQFDTYQNEGDPNDIANDHTSFVDTDAETDLSPVVDLGNLEDGAWHSVVVTWDGTTLSYTVDGVLAGTLTGDLAAEYFGGSDNVYFGVTGATGGLFNQTQVTFTSLNATSEFGTELALEGAGGATTYNQLIGDAQDNIIVGTGLRDNIEGNGGEDDLNGGAGNDTISGGTGNDTMAGGAGNDTFIYRPGFGYDTITDFGDGLAGNIDLIDFSAFGFTSANEVIKATYGTERGVGGDTVFDFGNGDVLVVTGTAAGYVTNLTANDFII